ncbi:MAG: MFS transporter [Deltaproteobacteria bacterium]|nr:MFS transporter [Deltaproteobacteria bacterium]MBT4264486.1 MFS transporter [Deltaproteobacteria bacterium]MBT4637737.1 MFS transporter [Deltaproteobacteria bacterium]MBT6499194.1 MFS transporter [Deltaproteobacteria bacterium]MBT6614732.1 MFS transporter [Deltaproteobacteria bacterium]
MTNEPGGKPLNANRALLILTIGTLSIAMGQSLVFALLPPLGRDLGLQEMQIGSIVTFSSLIFFISSPKWGRRSDHMGRKPVILIGLVGYTIGTVIFASIILMGLKAIISGLVVYIALVLARMGQSAVMSATPPGAGAYVADITSNQNRTSGMGKLGAANNIGTILGPGIGGALAVFSLLVPLYFAAVVTGISAIFVWRMLPKSPQIIKEPGDVKKLSYFDSRYFAFVVVGFIMFMSFSVVMQTAGFYFQDKLGLNGKETAQSLGLGMMASAIMSLFAQGVIVQFLNWRPLRLIIGGMPIILVSFLGLIFSENLIHLVISMAVMGLGTGMAGPGIFAGSSLTVSSEEQGSLAGLMSSCPPLGFIIGPMIGTGLYSLGPLYPYIFISIIFVPLIIFSWKIKTLIRRNYARNYQRDYTAT